MTQMTDLQLVEQYQETKKDVYLTTLINRYDGYIHNQAFRIYKNLSKFDREYEFDDVKQELKIAAIKAVNAVDRTRIKDRDKYAFYTTLGYKIQNFETNARRKKDIVHVNLLSTHSKISAEEMNVAPIERYIKMDDIIKKFNNTLNIKEQKIWKLFLEGKNQAEISVKVKISIVSICNNLRMIKRKFKEFIKN